MVAKRMRPTRGVRRSRRRTVMRPRMLRQVANRVSVKRTVNLATLTLTTAWAGALYTFTLGSLPNSSDFTNMFSAYRINAVRLLFIPLVTNLDGGQVYANQSAGSQWTTVPRLYTAIEKQSTAQYTSESGVQQYQNLRIIKRPLSPFSVYVKAPAVWESVQTTASSAFSQPKIKQWLSCDTPTVQHYGCVIGGILPGSSATGSVQYNVIATYYLQFKSAR